MNETRPLTSDARRNSGLESEIISSWSFGLKKSGPPIIPPIGCITGEGNIASPARR